MCCGRSSEDNFIFYEEKNYLVSKVLDPFPSKSNYFYLNQEYSVVSNAHYKSVFSTSKVNRLCKQIPFSKATWLTAFIYNIMGLFFPASQAWRLTQIFFYLSDWDGSVTAQIYLPQKPIFPQTTKCWTQYQQTNCSFYFQKEKKENVNLSFNTTILTMLVVRTSVWPCLLTAREPISHKGYHPVQCPLRPGPHIHSCVTLTVTAWQVSKGFWNFLVRNHYKIGNKGSPFSILQYNLHPKVWGFNSYFILSATSNS